MALEIEAKFLEVDKENLVSKLRTLGAEDLGENLLSEIIVYDRDLKMRKEQKFIRLRKVKDKCFLSYKHHKKISIDGTEEIELEIESMEKGVSFLESVGFVAYRRQEKRRHSFVLNNIKVDIDTWPKIPTYVEIEGGNEVEIKNTAKSLGFKWEDATFESARSIIEKVYSIPVGEFRLFTFEKIE